MIRAISLPGYMSLIEDSDIEATWFLSERWPISLARHPDLGRIALVHIGEDAWIVTPPATNLVGRSQPSDYDS